MKTLVKFRELQIFIFTFWALYLDSLRRLALAQQMRKFEDPQTYPSIPLRAPVFYATYGLLFWSHSYSFVG